MCIKENNCSKFLLFNRHIIAFIINYFFVNMIPSRAVTPQSTNKENLFIRVTAKYLFTAAFTFYNLFYYYMHT